MDERTLIERLLRIEALHAGATTPGERAAAESAMARIRARLKEVAAKEPPVEYRFSLSDPWKRQLFLALARRYGLQPYRRPGSQSPDRRAPSSCRGAGRWVRSTSSSR